MATLSNLTQRIEALERVRREKEAVDSITIPLCRFVDGDGLVCGYYDVRADRWLDADHKLLAGPPDD